jgi:hypothetical protein
MKDNNEAKTRKSLREYFGSKNIYCLEGMDCLLGLCNLLLRTGYEAESSAYRDTEKEIYYLIASEGASDNGLPLFSVLREYSFLTLQLARFACIAEHCSAFCEKDAVKTLGNLL